MCRFVVGCASSPDGFRWSKRGIVFDPVALGARQQDHDGGGALAASMVRCQKDGAMMGEHDLTRIVLADAGVEMLVPEYAV
jgi:hypothetical protein